MSPPRSADQQAAAAGSAPSAAPAAASVPSGWSGSLRASGAPGAPGASGASGQPSPAVHTVELRKRYRSTVALDGLSMTVRRGEVFGFLGPNGAGKTTAVKLLLGLVRPTSGEAMVLGAPAGDRETRRRIGYLPDPRPGLPHQRPGDGQHVSQYLLPTDGLWHAAIYYLEPSSYLVSQLADQGQRGDPFYAGAAPSAGYLAWAAVWFLVILAAGVVSFERREL